jgi:hypothetical protein
MKGKTKFLIFCMIFAVKITDAQVISIKPATSKGSGFYLSSLHYLNFPVNTSFSAIPSNYYSSRLGFFCKKEIRFETATGIPFKFRLGSVQTCDWMEGKRSAGIIRPGN